jgi:hypothetical protein
MGEILDFRNALLAMTVKLLDFPNYGSGNRYSELDE